MKQIGLTLTAVVLVVMTALPANALSTRASSKASVPSTVVFAMGTIPGTNICC